MYIANTVNHTNSYMYRSGCSLDTVHGALTKVTEDEIRIVKA